MKSTEGLLVSLKENALHQRRNNADEMRKNVNKDEITRNWNALKRQ